MHSDDRMYIAQFELEGEEQVRRNLARGAYGAHGMSPAKDWLQRQSAARDKQEQEARVLSERQARAAEIALELAERQSKVAEAANQLAKDANQLARNANRLSTWAVLVSIVSCILAVVAVLYDHA